MTTIGFYAALPLVSIPTDLPNSTEFNSKLVDVMERHHSVSKNAQEFEMILDAAFKSNTFYDKNGTIGESDDFKLVTILDATVSEEDHVNGKRDIFK